MVSFPSKIICLTEESVETLYLLGRSELIQGVSEYVMRPPEAQKLPQVTQFIRSDIDKIVAMKPDLVLGFSDLQKDIARDLIGRGLNVFVTNQRSLEEILSYIHLLGRLIDESAKAQALVSGFRAKLAEFRNRPRSYRPRVYFEEWDHPRLSCSLWVSELIEAAGGVNVFAHKTGAMAKDRAVTDEEIIAARPDLIIACWCGKPAKLDKIAGRPGYPKIPMVEVAPEIFLQPGPALFVDGLSQLEALLTSVKSGS